MNRPSLYLSAAVCLLLPAAFVRAERPFGSGDATPIPTIMMGTHMQVSIKQPAHPGDAARAADIEAIARTVLDHYRDPATAVRDGYHPYFDSGEMGAEIHYVNLQYSAREQRQIDYAHPGAILYKRTPQGLVAVGVMYSADADADAAELNSRVPLSIAPWHRHVDICKARMVPLTDQVRTGSKFGFRGSIHTQNACNQADGRWLPLVFGWMTHVYPDQTDPAKVWGGTDMHMAGAEM
jgi:hypothetical protein